MGNRLGEVGRILALCGLQVSFGFLEPGPGFGSDAAATSVDVLGDSVHPRLRGKQGLRECAVETIGIGLFFGQDGQQAVKNRVGLG